MPEVPSRTGRFEDVRLTTGRGAFTADHRRPDLAHACFARSMVACGRIEAVDVNAAQSLAGVLAVYTAADLDADGIPDLLTEIDPPRDDGGLAIKTPRPFLARDRVRYLGEPVAIVIAESAALAADAAALVGIAIDDSPVVTAKEDALAPGAPPVWPEQTDNIAFVRRLGDADAVDAAIAGAAHVTTLDLTVSRVVAATLEPRAALGECDAGGRLVLTTSTQGPYPLRNRLAADVFQIDPSRIRVIAPDVGGSFGMKSGVYREDAIVLWAARRLGRPVLWAAERTEGFLSDEHGRDVRARAELALDDTGAFVALRAKLAVNVGAYLSRRSFGLINNIGGIAGVYRTPAISAEIMGYYTNTVQTAPYRGAGRPEATYVIERLIDAAARELDIDPFDLRWQNLIPVSAMPYQTPLTFRYDCGDFAATMGRAAELADLKDFAARQAAARKAGRLRGIGIANPIEVAGGPLRNLRKDDAAIWVGPDGDIELRTGVMSVGQGHETGLAMLVADRLGVAETAVTYRQGDTDLLESGRGSGGSSALVVGGSAVFRAIEAVIEKGREISAEALEVAAADIEFSAGTYIVAGTDRSMSLSDAARLADAQAGITVAAEFKPEAVTYPNGCHICEVEIDTDTGVVALVRYVGVEDVGTVLNPVFVEGQMQGGVAQGIGQAAGEAIRYDSESGQLLTASFLDYPMPRAADMPDLRFETLAVPTTVNPLGVKGVGEAGTVGSLAATINAVNNALAQIGAGPIEMPATPGNVWKAIADARGSL
ncbi:MAG TPA: xanthine dehydrogenase family protein molybdopterin-binding subunit [Afifellaceae bacterium]|nr:xanthine dehydrogenase family protein molybdopterin-binding subunit [Afifellaceae bacterium]